MAYYVYCDDQLIMAAGMENCTLINPKLTLEKNSAGQFEFGMLPENPAYEDLTKMKSLIAVYEDDELLWRGRAVKVDTNFYLQKKVLCEGELAYLNDSVQPPAEYHDQTVAQFLETMINIHNGQVEADRRFKLGLVTVAEDANIYRYTNYESTLADIKDKLIDRLGGMLRVRADGNDRYIDYLKDYPSTCQQTIRFDTNLLDYSKTLTAADLATRCIPLGKRLDESPIEALDMRLDIKSVNNNSDVLELPEAVAKFGKVTKVVTWDDVTTAAALKSKGEAWLKDNQYEKLVLECKFADLHFMNATEDPVRILDRIQVVSVPHGMDHYFPVTKLCIDLTDPGKTEITLGDEASTSLTSSIISGQNAISGEIAEKPTFSQTRVLAQRMAKMLIDAGIGGYVYITPNELYVMEKPTLKDSKRFWRWNVNGFAYTSDGGKTYKTAITMDGAILADFINTGTMYADRIRGGTFVVGGSDGKNGTLQIKNSAGKVILQADKNGVSITGNAFTVDSNNFKLKSDGQMTAIDAKVTGNFGARQAEIDQSVLHDVSIDGKFSLERVDLGKVNYFGGGWTSGENWSAWEPEWSIDAKMTLTIDGDGITVKDSNGGETVITSKSIKTNHTIECDGLTVHGKINAHSLKVDDLIEASQMDFVDGGYLSIDETGIIKDENGEAYTVKWVKSN